MGRLSEGSALTAVPPRLRPLGAGVNDPAANPRHIPSSARLSQPICAKMAMMLALRRWEIRDGDRQRSHGCRPVRCRLPRVIALQGCSNLRDLGGYRAADGRHLRRGQVFRGASLANLTDTGLMEFAALGIRTVCDLRGIRSGRAPSRLPDRDAPEVVRLPIEPRVGASLRDLLARNATKGEDMYACCRPPIPPMRANTCRAIAGCSSCCWRMGGCRCCFTARPGRTGPGSAPRCC